MPSRCSRSSRSAAMRRRRRSTARGSNSASAATWSAPAAGRYSTRRSIRNSRQSHHQAGILMSSPAVADRAPLIAGAQKFARYPSQQTALFEQEPEVQDFIGDGVMPLVRELGLPARRDRMGNLLVELGPPDPRRSLMLMG